MMIKSNRTSSQYARDCTTGEPQDPGGGRVNPGSRASSRFSSPFLNVGDLVRNALCSLGRDGQSTSRDEFLSYHSPTNQPKPPESLWYISFRDGSQPSATHGVSRIYDDYTYPLSRFELTVLSTKFQDSNLHVISSFRVICEESNKEIAVRGEISDIFKPDPGMEGRYYLVHRSLTFTIVRRPELLERRRRIQLDCNGRLPTIPGASRRYDKYVQLSYLTRLLREVRKALNPTLVVSALVASVAANPSLSVEVRSGFAVTGSVISSVSCFFFAAGVLVEILETKVRGLILDVAPAATDGSVTQGRSNFFRNLIAIKRYFSLFVAFAALAASISSHPDIPQSTRKGFAVSGIVLVATGCALYVVGMATSILVQIDSIPEGGAKDESSKSVEEQSRDSFSSSLQQ
ncbi:hypothetical protein BT69DRAFT_1349242 [Atractiella rhizophila]|nr:hypothetical protein BT69DRAFT_1349242 [Atractiella rhizophila]